MEHVHELRTELAADRWAVDHADDLARYATLRNELASRGRANVLCHRHTDIPEYLTADLGDRPTAPHERGIWDRDAVRIEHFRVTYDIADAARVLGDRPHELRARGAYDQALRDIAVAKKQLAREQARRRGRSRPLRQMTLGFGR